MSAIDVLAVLDAAKRVAVLCDPAIRIYQHPASNSLEAQAFNLRGEIDEAREAVAELIEAANLLVSESVHPYDGGEYEDGEWIALDRARAALARCGGAA